MCLWANQMPGFLILSISRTNQLLPLSIVNIFYLFPCIFFLSKIARFHLVMICFFLLFHKCQCCPHIETSQLICFANQLTGFSKRATLAFNGVIKIEKKILEKVLLDIRRKLNTHNTFMRCYRCPLNLLCTLNLLELSFSEIVTNNVLKVKSKCWRIAQFFFSLFFFTRIFLVTFSVVLIVLVTNFLSCFNDIILDDENSFAC